MKGQALKKVEYSLPLLLAGVKSGTGVESGTWVESGARVESGTENIIFDILALYAVRKYVTCKVFSVLCLKASKLT